MYTQARVSPDMKRRLASFKGWAYSPIVLADLMVHTSAATQGLSDFQLYEGRSLTPSALVYDSANPKGAVPQSDPLDRVAKRMFSVSRPLFVGGQTFQLHASSTEDFERQIDQNEISRLAFTGSALSVLAGAFLWVLLIGRARAVSIARDLTKDLERLAMVAQHTSNAVVMTDAAGQVVWVNEGFTRITGFCAEEVLGKTPGSILQCEKTDPAAVEAIRAAIAAQRPCKQFILNRSKQGHDYWVDLEIQPLRNERQELTGFMAIESDVTDSVEAKRALAQEKERADNILTGTNVGTWESNLVTGEFTTNARWSLMMGFERGEVLPDAEAFWLERLHPDDRIRINNAMDVCIAGKEDHYSCDVRVQRKDGSWMWILRRAQVMARTATGAVEWLGGIHTDISDVKNTEINLRDMESFLERTGRVAGIGAWQVNLRTNEIVWNDQTCDIHGVEPGYRPTMEDALGFYPPRAREQVQVVMARAIEMGSNWDLTTEFVNARGKARWVRSVGEVEFDDSGAVRLLGAFQDVTKERDAQRNIERSEAIFREAIATINEAFVLYDPDDRLVFCNEKYKELYAVSADLIVPGATFESIVRGGAERGQYAEAVGRIDEWVEECLAVHRASNINVEQRLGNGKWLRIVERKLPDGHIVGFRVDITQLKNSLEVAEAARAALAHEQARLKNILEGTNVGTWEWNL
jgi:PAS domain S-box-containing protein